jgi:hypothetical protein
MAAGSQGGPADAPLSCLEGCPNGAELPVADAEEVSAEVIHLEVGELAESRLRR